MVKISPRNTESFIKNPPPNLRVALIYGPDEGLVRERIYSLSKVMVEDLSDPFLICDLAIKEVLADPPLLADEVAAISMTGGRRLITVRDSSDGITTTIKEIIKDMLGDTFVILQAGPLSPRSSLRKLAELSPISAAIACYADDPIRLKSLIRETLSQHNVRIANGAINWLIEFLGADRAASRSEIEKLAILAGPNNEITLEMVMASVGDGATESLDDLVYAVGNGNFKQIDLLLFRCLQTGSSSVGILRALTTHLLRLNTTIGRIANGAQPTAAIKLLRPPVFFKLEKQFQQQLQIWPSEHLMRGLQVTLEAELLCKQKQFPQEAICGRTLLQVASLARRRRRLDQNDPLFSPPASR